MDLLILLVTLLVGFSTVLATAESSISRMTRVRALALVEEGRRNAVLLERIESDPATYLNSVYLAVMCVQNGSAVLVAIMAERYFHDLGVAVISALFTLVYFVVVEAMGKTFGILHSTEAALTLAPVVWLLGRALAGPTRLLIWIANVLLPGKGRKQGPFVSPEEILSMAEVGHAEGVIEEREKDLIHSVFEFGDTVVREVMVPRPDIVAVEAHEPLRTVQEAVLSRGFSRIPVYRDDIDHVEGIVHAKDVLRALHQGRQNVAIAELARPAHFVPMSKAVADLLREMQQQRFHLAIVTDEYGSVVGLVTLEDLLEELVGEILDEHDQEEPQIRPAGPNAFRASGRLPIAELNELLDVELPHEEWDTVGGLMLGLIGAIPREGQEVQVGTIRFKAERVQGLRVGSVLITRLDEAPSGDDAALTAVGEGTVPRR